MLVKKLLIGCVLGLLISCGGEEPKASDKTPKAAPVAVNKTAPKAAPAAAAAAGSCPEAMSEYEAFVDKYIAYMKKVSNGDMSAMSQAQPLMAQADKAGKKIANMRGDLNAECLKRYNAISKKMTDAAMEMSGASATDKAQVEAMQKASDKAVEAASCVENCQKNTDPMKAATCMQKCM